MATIGVAGYAAIVAAAAGTYTAVEAKKGNEAEAAAAERLQQSQQKEAEAKRLRQRQQAQAVAARARADIAAQQAAAGIGVGGRSTAIQQASGSITSQLSSNLGFLQQLEQFQTQQFGIQSEIRDIRKNTANKVGYGQAVGSIAGSVGQGFA